MRRLKKIRHTLNLAGNILLVMLVFCLFTVGVLFLRFDIQRGHSKLRMFVVWKTWDKRDQMQGQRWRFCPPRDRNWPWTSASFYVYISEVRVSESLIETLRFLNHERNLEEQLVFGPVCIHLKAGLLWWRVFFRLFAPALLPGSSPRKPRRRSVCFAGHLMMMMMTLCCQLHFWQERAHHSF